MREEVDFPVVSRFSDLADGVIAILHLLSNMSLSAALNVNKLDLSSVLVLTL